MIGSPLPACSMGRSTASASWPTRRSSWHRPYELATSWWQSLMRGCPSSDPCDRRQAVLPAALRSGPQPDRADVRQAQDAAAKGCGTICRGNMEGHRSAVQEIQPAEAYQLPCQRWLCGNVMQSGSKHLSDALALACFVAQLDAGSHGSCLSASLALRLRPTSRSPPRSSCRNWIASTLRPLQFPA
jgi:hypothetical protein